MKFSKPDRELSEFIKNNEKEDIASLVLKHRGKNYDFDIEHALIQIECRKKCAVKLKNFISNPDFLFPTIVSAEQASHEAVALFHASLAGTLHKGIDLTAGLGIDALTLSKSIDDMTACEIDTDKADALEYNKNVFSRDNLKVVNADSIDYIGRSDTIYDLAFIDPARRGKENCRVYSFKDCQPDVCSILPLLVSRSKRIMIKASPLLDITQTIRDIPSLSSIYAVSVNGECKEILIVIDNGSAYDNSDNSTIKSVAVDLDNDGNVRNQFSFSIEMPDTDSKHGSYDKDTESHIRYASKEDIVTGRFLYEPNAPVMKFAPWNDISNRYPSLKKMDISSHLFIGEKYLPDFPGRITRITYIPSKKDRKTLKGLHANIVSRNYPLSAAELRKKLGVKEGKDTFLYATRLNDDPLLILSEKIY